MRNESNTGRPTIGNSRAGGGNPNGPANQRNSNSIWLAAAAVLSVLILALAVLNFQKYGVFGDDGEASAEAPSPKEEEKEPTEAAEPTKGTADDQFPDSSQLQAQVSDSGTPWIVGHQEAFKYRISGAVPSEEIKQAISESVTAVYGDSPDVVKNELTVDPNLSAAPWLENSPSFGKFVKAVPFTLVDGAFAINDQNTNLSGRVESQAAVDKMLAEAETAGLPEVDSSIVVADLRPSTIIANARDGKLDLVGAMPSQRIVDAIVGDSIALYGEENVKQNIAIDDGTFARFPVSRFGKSNIATFYPLGDFVIRLDQGELTAEVDGGVVFEPGSAELTADTKEKLKGFPKFLQVRSSRPAFVIGHTDNTGDPEENRVLSQQRADAVKKFLVDNGVDTEQITAEGKGESEELKPNDTPENKAKNRRVEIKFGQFQ